MPTFNYLLNDVYGLSGGAQAGLPDEQRQSYVFALFKIAAADGELSDAERQQFIEFAASAGAPAEHLEAFRQFDPDTVDMDTLLQSIKAIRPARALLYDAIKVSSADGYADKERAAIETAAQVLGVGLDVVRALEGVVAAEAAVRQTRVALLDLGA